jgi:polyketide cyclase/dehydrase/lipid transport protein
VRRFADRSTFTFDVPPDALWRAVSDTDAVNRDAGLPPVRYTYEPKAGGPAATVAHARLGPLALEWEEPPFTWEAPHRIAVERRFRRGPFARLASDARVVADGEGARVEHAIELEANGALGALLGPAVLARVRAGAARAYAVAAQRARENGPVVPAGGIARVARFTVEDDAGAGTLDVRVDEDGIRAATSVVQSGTVRVRIENASAREAVVRVNEADLSDQIATAADVTALQAFRDLFSGEVLGPGIEFAIRALTVVFTDVAGSTQMYADTGDADAFRLVREHVDAVQDVIGATVNLAARVAHAAGPGEILITAAAADDARVGDMLADGERGTVVLRGIRAPVDVVLVRAPAARTPE